MPWTATAAQPRQHALFYVGTGLAMLALMKMLAAVEGVIARRILVNYRVDPGVLARLLPAPFRPQLVRGQGVAGICLIRLQDERVRGLPAALGYASENAAHRIAVEWDDEHGARQTGVYVPRRDTSSSFNAWLGGRLFPGLHTRADFEVHESADDYRVKLQSRADGTTIDVQGRLSNEWPADSLFGSLAESSAFFAAGSRGYSNTHTPGVFDGLALHCAHWHVDPLALRVARSSFFDDHTRFPAGSVSFDHALLMRDIPHEWRGLGSLCAASV